MVLNLDKAFIVQYLRPKITSCTKENKFSFNQSLTYKIIFANNARHRKYLTFS